MLVVACSETTVDAKGDKPVQEDLLKQFGKLDGKAQSLEPLSKEQCFGETFAEKDVRSLLESIYPKEDIPISGLGLFLGVDKDSIAIRNREFRYMMVNNNNSEIVIFDNISNFLAPLVLSLKFTPENFANINIEAKQSKNIFDYPVIVIQSAGSNSLQADNFEPFYGVFIGEDLDKQVSKDKSSVSAWIEKNKDKSEGNYLVRGRTNSSALKLKQVSDENKLFHISYYSFFIYHEESLSEMLRSEFKEIAFKNVRDFYNTTLLGGVSDMIYNNSILTILDFGDKEYFLDKELISPSPFDQVLFAAIYKRIKPINMQKQNFIDAVMTVIKPCLS